MVIFNALLNLRELKELYSGKPVCVCPLYKGVINVLKTFEATGNPIVLPEYKSLVKLKTTFSPKQEGTGDPSPDNVRPITGYDSVQVTRCGKNLLDTSDSVRDGWNVRLPNATLVKGATYTYTVPNTVATDKIVALFVYASNTRLTGYLGAGRSATFTVPNDVDLSEGLMLAGGTETSVDNVNPSDFMVELGSTPTPYQGNDYILTLPETIYGGTVDAVTGVGEKTWEFVEFDGTEDWYQNENGYFLHGVVDIGIGGRRESVSNISVNSGYTISPIPDGQFNTWSFLDQRGWCGFSLSFADSLDSWKSYLAAQASAGTPVQVAYKLATPEPFEISKISIPSLIGENTFFTNGDNMDIIYKESSFWSDEA